VRKELSARPAPVIGIATADLADEDAAAASTSGMTAAVIRTLGERMSRAASG